MTAPPPPGRVLALDVGSRRVGVALSDRTRTVAAPLLTLPRRGTGEDAQAVAALIADHEVDTVVVGLPLSLSGSEGPAAVAVREYVAELRIGLHGVEVVLMDERFSTVTAERALIQGNVKRAARRAVVDQVAASVFLQSWLDARAGLQRTSAAAEGAT